MSTKIDSHNTNECPQWSAKDCKIYAAAGLCVAIPLIVGTALVVIGLLGLHDNLPISGAASVVTVFSGFFILIILGKIIACVADQPK